MKKSILVSAILVGLTTTTAFANSEPKKSLESVAPYPKATKNQNRNVIWLDKKPNEDKYKVEVYAEKEAMKDCNNVFYGAEMKEKTLEGWGYTYSVIGETKGAASTMMGCLDGKKSKQFVPVNFDGGFARYNSKLPLVIYAPKDMRISYKIWTTDEVAHRANIQ